MKKVSKLFLVLSLFFVSVFFVSCGKRNVEPENSGNVAPAPVVVSISIEIQNEDYLIDVNDENNRTLIFLYGDEIYIQKSDLVVTLNYNNGTTRVISDYEIDMSQLVEALDDLQNVSVGSYTVSVTYSNFSEELTVNVLSAEIQKPTLATSQRLFTYDVDENRNAVVYNPEITGFDENTMVISQESVIQASSVGTYKIEITPKAGFAWQEFDESETEKVEFEWSIQKKMLALQIPEVLQFEYLPNADYSAGQSQSLNIEYDENIFVLQGNLNGTNVGNYTTRVAIKTSEQSNYLVEVADPDGDFVLGTEYVVDPNNQYVDINWKIVKKVLNLVDLSKSEYVYNTNQIIPEVTGYISQIMNADYGNAVDVSENPYAAVFTIKDTFSQSYKWIGDVQNSTVQFYILKADFEAIENDLYIDVTYGTFATWRLQDKVNGDQEALNIESIVNFNESTINYLNGINVDGLHSGKWHWVDGEDLVEFIAGNVCDYEIFSATYTHSSNYKPKTIEINVKIIKADFNVNSVNWNYENGISLEYNILGEGYEVYCLLPAGVNIEVLSEELLHNGESDTILNSTFNADQVGEYVASVDFAVNDDNYNYVAFSKQLSLTIIANPFSSITIDGASKSLTTLNTLTGFYVGTTFNFVLVDGYGLKLNDNELTSITLSVSNLKDGKFEIVAYNPINNDEVFVKTFDVYVVDRMIFNDSTIVNTNFSNSVYELIVSNDVNNIRINFNNSILSRYTIKYSIDGAAYTNITSVPIMIGNLKNVSLITFVYSDSGNSVVNEEFFRIETIIPTLITSIMVSIVDGESHQKNIVATLTGLNYYIDLEDGEQITNIEINIEDEDNYFSTLCENDGSYNELILSYDSSEYLILVRDMEGEIIETHILYIN